MSSPSLFVRFAPASTMLALGGAAMTPYDQTYGHPPGYGSLSCSPTGSYGAPSWGEKADKTARPVKRKLARHRRGRV